MVKLNKCRDYKTANLLLMFGKLSMKLINIPIRHDWSQLEQPNTMRYLCK